MNIRNIAASVLVAFLSLPIAVLAFFGGSAEHSLLLTQIRAAAALEVAKQMVALLTNKDKFEIGAHQQTSLERTSGRSSVRIWENALGAQWIHTLTIGQEFRNTERGLVCKTFREELTVRDRGREFPVAKRGGTACKPVAQGITAGAVWQLGTPDTATGTPTPISNKDVTSTE